MKQLKEKETKLKEKLTKNKEIVESKDKTVDPSKLIKLQKKYKYYKNLSTKSKL